MRLGVNIDHIATLRNARGENHPNIMRAVKVIEQTAAFGITIHLREDRRHIKDADVFAIKENSHLPINLEMAATDEMLEIALKVQPHSCCIVPEKREELTTEGGLNLRLNKRYLSQLTEKLLKSNIKPCFFIDADEEQVKLARELGATIIELHTGSYANYCRVGDVNAIQRELDKLSQAAKLAAELGLQVHAGHGLNFENTPAIVKIKQIEELNIGQFLVGEAIFFGLESVVKEMLRIIKMSS